ncbi:MAG: MBL fold metallo-hydrolase [Candidatus Marinimicrobia bacterium]|nr:MBL fold metallo-hydrolase [Candidatus Neomarinimicrobiota bacterium]
MIKTRQLFDQETWTFTYLLFDDESNKCVLIDPVLEQIDRDLSLISRLELILIGVLETHVHADHVTAAKEIKLRSNVKVYYGSKSGVDCADILLDDGDTVELGENKITAIHTPGHTIGCTTYYIDNKLFTGDTLFIGGTGRTDFQGGSADNTYDSCRKKIFTYPDETLIYPAHNYKGLTISTVGEERKWNPNVGDGVSKKEYIENENNIDRPYPHRFDVAVPANTACGNKN